MLHPLVGGIAGLLAAALMPGLIALLQPLSGLAVDDIFFTIGSTIVPATAAMRTTTPALLASGGLHAVLGMLFGVLYATSQQRIPLRGLIGVGYFYGLLIWVVSSFLITPLISEHLVAVIRTWPWFLACLLYGLTLAAVATIVDRQTASQNTIVVPKD